ncbi:MAG: hypothetical protein DMD76_10635 [Candidatus Rokuibacteriota bacterium]|nr:MAG: hypothetical protein DMD76_10635 [Candidatus Rokubacteria bacterium]
MRSPLSRPSTTSTGSSARRTTARSCRTKNAGRDRPRGRRRVPRRSRPGRIVALAGWIDGGAPRALAVGAVAAVVGNCWSLFLGFRGGKGVATGLGALLRLTPLATLAALPVFLVVVITTRFVSLGSLLGAACVPFGALALGAPRPAVAGAVAVAAIVVLRHHENIARLRAGTERRLGERRASGAQDPAP